MTPISRETAQWTGASVTDVAHSRKDAEPVGYTDASWLTQPSGTFVTKPHPSFKMALFTHPPEADKLLQQALEALDGALSDDKPYIAECKGSATAIRTYLEGK